MLADFLYRTERLPREEAAAIAGVGIATLRRWELSGVQHMRSEQLRRMLDYSGAGSETPRPRPHAEVVDRHARPRSPKPERCRCS